MRRLDSTEVAFSLLGVALMATACVLVWAIVQAQDADRQWRAWAAEHCKVVGHMDGSSGVAPTFGLGKPGFGVTLVTTPGRTGYLCDDGVTYWK